MEGLDGKKTNVLGMYRHLDGYWRSAKVSSLYMSWLYFKKMFELVFNDSEESNVKKLNGTIIDKILAVGYVLFTLVGCLALLIALCVLVDAGLGPLFFVCFGTGASLLGIVVIGTIIAGAICRNMIKKRLTLKIWLYLIRKFIIRSQACIILIKKN